MNSIRIFDVETTGTNAEVDRIVEIAAFDLPPDRIIKRVGSFLVNPERPIPPEASAVHHLVDAHVANAPLFRDVWVEHFQDDAPTIYAAHNCEFEQGFLPTPEGTAWICTYKAALRAWPDAPGHSNQVLRYWLGLDAKEDFDSEVANIAHRAAPDAYVTAMVLLELLQRASIEEMIAWTAEPKVYAKLNFGKHRGQTWAEIPIDYLTWLRDGQHQMDADWRHGARLEVERRRQAYQAARESRA